MSHPLARFGAMQVEVVRSPSRRKTVHARERDGVVYVRIPAWMSKAEEEACVAKMVARLSRRRVASDIDLERRALVLCTRYGLPAPESIRWVTNQESRWASCTPASRSLRLSDRLAGFPAWVVDYVLVHELAHLREANHGPAFWRLVNRYPKAERARGFLIAKGLGDDDDDAAAGGGDPELRATR